MKHYAHFRFAVAALLACGRFYLIRPSQRATGRKRYAGTNSICPKVDGVL